MQFTSPGSPLPPCGEVDVRRSGVQLQSADAQRQKLKAEDRTLNDEQASRRRPAGGSDCQCFGRDFDGKQFTLDASFPRPHGELLLYGTTLAKGSQGVKLFKGAREETLIGVDHGAGRIYVERPQSGNVTFHPKLSGVHVAPLPAGDRRVKRHLLVDACSVEVFVNDGERVLPGWCSLPGFFSQNNRHVQWRARPTGQQETHRGTIPGGWKLACGAEPAVALPDAG